VRQHPFSRYFNSLRTRSGFAPFPTCDRPVCRAGAGEKSVPSHLGRRVPLEADARVLADGYLARRGPDGEGRRAVKGGRRLGGESGVSSEYFPVGAWQQRYDLVFVMLASVWFFFWPRLLRTILSSDRFMPHGTGYLWIPQLVALRLISNDLNPIPM